MKAKFVLLMSVLFLSSANAAESKGILCWALEGHSMRYLFDQASARRPGQPLSSSMNKVIGSLEFSAGFVPGGNTQPNLSLSILDRQTGLKIWSSQSKLGFARIEANSYEQLVYEKTKTGTQIMFTCKVAEDGVALPGNTN